MSCSRFIVVSVVLFLLGLPVVSSKPVESDLDEPLPDDYLPESFFPNGNEDDVDIDDDLESPEGGPEIVHHHAAEAADSDPDLSPASRNRGGSVDAARNGGKYCAVVGCCEGRNDRCSIEHFDTFCYCDLFCNRSSVSESDCCPDYVVQCVRHGAGNVNGAADEGTLDVEDGDDGTDGGQPEGLTHVTNECLHGGQEYNVNDKVLIACNNCTCELDDDTAPARYQWRCTKRHCALKPELLKRINSENQGWQAFNYPEFEGKTVDEVVKHKLGTRQPDPEALDMNGIKLPKDGTIPHEFDARQQWPGWIGSPTDQGDCGASWAFSTASVASDRLAIQTRGASVVRLSAYQLISCIYHHLGENGCHPNGFDRAWWFTRKTGIVSENCYPTPRSPSDPDSPSSSPAPCLLPRSYSELVESSCPSGTDKQLTVYRSAPPYKIAPTEEEIMKEIRAHGPVQALMEPKDDFYSYKRGVYRSTLSDSDLTADEHKKRTHSVKIIGWGTDHSLGKPVKYWLCANSWGEKWGENGYFRIVRGENECGIESLVIGVWMNVAETQQSLKQAEKHHLATDNNNNKKNNNKNNGHRRRRLY